MSRGAPAREGMDMGFWQKLFGPRERPEETLRLTRRVMDLMAEGKSDDEVQRTLFREGVPVERAAALVAQVRGLRARFSAGS
ncbi:MAG TPA: hypothetical protein VEB59_03755 [Gemmatimonadales bacterium]|nr:hypothetical protein [Gemmatimonadales bacterium]